MPKVRLSDEIKEERNYQIKKFGLVERLEGANARPRGQLGMGHGFLSRS